MISWLISLQLLSIPGKTVFTDGRIPDVRGIELATTYEEPLQLELSPQEGLKDTYEWVLCDTLNLALHLPQQERAAFSVGRGDQINMTYMPDSGLVTLAVEALDVAPQWVRDELFDNFQRLDSTYQEIYAQMIIDPPEERFRDEIAFTVAHVSPEILQDSTFDPQLLLVNAEFLYRNDDSLDFVDIVDYDGPGGDYYSTVCYRVQVEGDTVERELEPYYYYFYIAHPQLSDESPRMDEYVYNKFWREYLLYEADSGYPLLMEKIRSARLLWVVTDTPQVLPGGREFDSTQTALDIIGNWASRTVPEPASGNRPIQPNVIAHEHNGNCGELQDLLAAACRACLIPTTSVFTLAEDHVWNEFYDEGWHEYQVDLGFGATHINDPRTAYDHDHGGSKEVSSVMEWRSDGLVRTVTGHYSSTCSLFVKVEDLRGLPVDGARILLYSEGWYGGYDVSCWGFTDELGRAYFELGNLRNFYFHINSPLGDYPSDPSGIIQIISYSQTGGHYYKTVALPYFAAFPVYEPQEESGFPLYKVKIDVDLRYEILHGYARARRNTGDEGFYHTYCEKVDDVGSVYLFVMDSTNYSLYNGGLPFRALVASKITDDTVIDVRLRPSGSRYFVVISNEENLTTSVGLNLGLSLYRNKLTEVAEVRGDSRIPELSISPLFSRGKATIRLSCGEGSRLSLDLYDVSGRKLSTILDGQMDGGDHRIPIDLNLPSGLYFLRLKAGPEERVAKFVIVR